MCVECVCVGVECVWGVCVESVCVGGCHKINVQCTQCVYFSITMLSRAPTCRRVLMLTSLSWAYSPALLTRPIELCVCAGVCVRVWGWCYNIAALYYKTLKSTTINFSCTNCAFYKLPIVSMATRVHYIMVHSLQFP